MMAVVNHPNPPHKWVDADGNVDWDAYASEQSESGYEGPDQVGYAKWPGRGTTYHFRIAGHDFEVYITEKQKRVRVYVDNDEWQVKQ